MVAFSLHAVKAMSVCNHKYNLLSLIFYGRHEPEYLLIFFSLTIQDPITLHCKDGDLYESIFLSLMKIIQLKYQPNHLRT